MWLFLKPISAMKTIVPLVLFVCYIGYIGSVPMADMAKCRINSSLFEVFDNLYHEAVVNQTKCRDLRSRARSFSLDATTAMPEMDLDENFVCFCSTSPYYELITPTAEWIFSSSFVQYSVIQSIFSLTVCRIYNLYALENPNVQRADDCAKVASYLNVFRSIVIEDRISEIEKIYQLVANPSSSKGSRSRKEKQPHDFSEALSMSNMKAKLLKLDALLDRLTDVIETEGSQRVPSVSCKMAPLHKQKHSSPLGMHLDFYINANMNARNAPSCALESIESKYTKSRSSSARDENYRRYYYEEAWSDIFRNFYADFFPMVNYFNKVLYCDEVIPIRSGEFKPFIPPFEESLKVWARVRELRTVIETSEHKENRSKVATILEKIQVFKMGLVLTRKVELTYNNKGRNEPDFFVNVKNHY